MNEFGYIYILTNDYNTTFYIGVTSNLIKRVTEHKNKVVDGFTKTYNLYKLVYFEQYNSIQTAIQREKNLKNWHKQWKINLIKNKNPYFIDLYKYLTIGDDRVEIIIENNKNYIYNVAIVNDNAMLKQVQHDETTE